MYQSIANWYEPSDTLYAKASFTCEMSREDHGFLCGLIRHFKPNKIVEIGVAEGGTTGVITNALNMLGVEADFYSVDLNERLFCNTEYETGYQYKELKQRMDLSHKGVRHKFMFGKTIAGQIKEIGANIDMVIIDTMHRLPGELLDFLCVLPYMSKNGIVVLHDVNLNYFKTLSDDPYEVSIANVRMATKILLTVAAGEKYINVTDKMCMNIGGIKISEDTLKYVQDIFMMLTGTWDYKLGEKLIEEYREVYKKHFDDQCLKLFDVAVETNKCIYHNTLMAWLKQDLTYISCKFPYREIPYGAKIAIYGANAYGKMLRLLSQITGYCIVTNWVDDGWKKIGTEMVQAPYTLKNSSFDYVLIAEEDKNKYDQIKMYLLLQEIATEKQIVKELEQVNKYPAQFITPKYRFPYEEIPVGCKICLYGAGQVGKDIYNTLKFSKYCEISGWVDSNYEKLMNLGVRKPSDMLGLDFDVVLITVKDEGIFEQIKGQILTNKWNKGRLIVGPLQEYKI